MRGPNGQVFVRVFESCGQVMPYQDLVEMAPLWMDRIRSQGGPMYFGTWEAFDGAGGYAMEVWNQ